MDLGDILSEDAVRALGVIEPVTVGPEQPVGDVIGLMQEQHVGCVVVVERRRPIGVFTERDVLTKVLAKAVGLTMPVADVMTGTPQVVRDGCRIDEIIRTMHQGGFRHMPVVDGSGFLQSVVTVNRIVEYLVELFPATVCNLPPESAQTAPPREGA